LSNEALNTDPIEDVGAATAGRFEWQAAMAAVDAISLYREWMPTRDDSAEIVCELHEDWIVVQHLKEELVSAKHRELTVGPWTTLHQLASDGGLAHLHSRWTLLNRAPLVRLVTNAPLAKEARELHDCIADLRRRTSESTSLRPTTVATIRQFAREIMESQKDLPQAWLPVTDQKKSDWPIAPGLINDCERFLEALTIDDTRPSRTFMHDVAPKWVKEMLRELGADESRADEVWNALMGLVRLRMRAAGPSVVRTPPAGSSLLPPHPVLSQDLEISRRTLSVQDISVLIEVVLANPGGFQPVRPPFRTSKLGFKMQRGGCLDTSIDRAEQLRLGYRRYMRERQASTPGPNLDVAAATRQLHRIADKASSSVFQQDRPWGQALWRELDKQLDDPTAFGEAMEMDRDIALGGICDLANQCLVWFSPRFDIAAEMSVAKGAQ
jgi:hypothetical protein